MEVEKGHEACPCEIFMAFFVAWQFKGHEKDHSKMLSKVNKATYRQATTTAVKTIKYCTYFKRGKI